MCSGTAIHHHRTYPLRDGRTPACCRCVTPFCFHSALFSTLISLSARTYFEEKNQGCSLVGSNLAGPTGSGRVGSGRIAVTGSDRSVRIRTPPDLTDPNSTRPDPTRPVSFEKWVGVVYVIYDPWKSPAQYGIFRPCFLSCYVLYNPLLLHMTRTLCHLFYRFFFTFFFLFNTYFLFCFHRC